MIQKNWKSYFLGFLTGIALSGLFIIFKNNEKGNSTDTSTKEVQSTAIENSKKDNKVVKEKSKVGTLTNPVLLGDYQEFSDKELLGDSTFEIGTKIEEFKPAQDLPNFEPRFYGKDKLKDNNTYYGTKINIKVLKGSDQNTPYYFDSVNYIHVFVDGAESSDRVIDINQNDYSGIDGNITIGAEKTGWFGFQAPTNAKNIILKIGSYGANFYMKLK